MYKTISLHLPSDVADRLENEAQRLFGGTDPLTGELELLMRDTLVRWCQSDIASPPDIDSAGSMRRDDDESRFLVAGVARRHYNPGFVIIHRYESDGCYEFCITDSDSDVIEESRFMQYFSAAEALEQAHHRDRAISEAESAK